jgi:hypothetical protein
MRISLDVQASHLVRAEMLALLRDVRLRTAVRFYRFRGEHLDVLVNNVWGGYERMVDKRRIYMVAPILATTPVAVGRHVLRRSPCALRGRPSCCSRNG